MTDTIQKDKLTAASSSFNAKSIVASFLKKYETTVSAISKYTKIYIGKWMSTVIS